MPVGSTSILARFYQGDLYSLKWGGAAIAPPLSLGGVAIRGSELATRADRTLSRRAARPSSGMSAKGGRHTGIPAVQVCDAWSFHFPLRGVSCHLTRKALYAVLFWRLICASRRLCIVKPLMHDEEIGGRLRLQPGPSFATASRFCEGSAADCAPLPVRRRNA